MFTNDLGLREGERNLLLNDIRCIKIDVQNEKVSRGLCLVWF